MRKLCVCTGRGWTGQEPVVVNLIKCILLILKVKAARGGPGEERGTTGQVLRAGSVVTEEAHPSGKSPWGILRTAITRSLVYQ